MKNVKENPLTGNISFKLGFASGRVANLYNMLLDAASESEDIEILETAAKETMNLLNSTIVEALKLIDKEKNQ